MATAGKSECRSATARLATVASSIARKAAPEATASTVLDERAAATGGPAAGLRVLAIRTLLALEVRTVVLFSTRRTIVLFFFAP